MMRYTKNQKEEICKALKLAEEKVIHEQDHWRERMKNIKKSGGTNLNEKLAVLGWEGLNELMKDEFFPPTDEDRNRYLELSGEHTSYGSELNMVEDLQVWGHMHILQETVDQRDRIRAMVRFFEVLAITPDCDEAWDAFYWWMKYSIYKQLAKQLKPCKSGGYKVVALLANAMTMIFDDFARRRMFGKNQSDIDEIVNEADALLNAYNDVRDNAVHI
jgi:hypothetical protein